jgi:hypothetical protein
MTSRKFSDSEISYKKEVLLQKDESLIQDTTRTEFDLQIVHSNNKISDNSLAENDYPFLRWIILASFCFLTFVNGATWVIFCTIIEEAQTYYNASETQILWFIWQFNIIYVVVSFPVFCS